MEKNEETGSPGWSASFFMQTTEDVARAVAAAATTVRSSRPSVVFSSKDDSGSQLQKLQSQFSRVLKGFSSPPEVKSGTYNPEILTSQKRQWTSFQLQSLDNRIFSKPSRLLESVVVAGLHPNCDLQTLHKQYFGRKSEGSGRFRSALSGQYQSRVEPNIEPQVLFVYPPEKQLPLNYKDLLSFCFPGGIEVHAVERTPSMSELNEILLGQEHLKQSDLSFVFRLQERILNMEKNEETGSPGWSASFFMQTTEDVARAVAAAATTVRSSRPSVVFSSKDDSGSQLQKLQSQFSRVLKGFSSPPEVKSGTYNPEILTSQKRQWTSFQLQSLDNRIFSKPSRLLESVVVAGLHPNCDLQTLHKQYFGRKSEGSGRFRSALSGQYQSRVEPNIEPQVLFVYPPEKQLPLNYKDLLSFCFPGGIEVHAVERTPSMSELNEILLGQEHLKQSDLSFVFRLQERILNMEKNEETGSPGWSASFFMQTTEDVARAVAAAATTVRSSRPSVVFSSKDDSGSQLQKLQSQFSRVLKGFSSPPEVKSGTYNPEILTSQKRQWTSFQLQSLDNRIFSKPSRLLESVVVAGLHPNCDLQTLHKQYFGRKSEGSGRFRSALSGQYQSRVEPNIEPQVLFVYPPEKQLPLNYKDLLSFCFPGGIEVHAVERTPSMSELNEILLGQEHLKQSDLSFVFRLQERILNMEKNEETGSPGWSASFFMQTTEDVARAVAAAATTVRSSRPSVVFSSKDDSGSQLQKLQSQFSRVLKGFSSPPEVKSGTYNPEILTSQKRQWTSFQLQSLDNRIFSKPSRLLESVVVAGLHPNCDLQTLHKQYFGRKSEGSGRFRSALSGQYQSRVEPNIEPQTRRLQWAERLTVTGSYAAGTVYAV
ncbi:unnamed protein product [Ilex paraguariensis]|uniref:uDENN domain-containing protein n=1 Tax=Ilex paraguariensis TaxID=185542 RepID=A0ABC8RHB0_9AQUA